jgi:hypothetical protein
MGLLEVLVGVLDGHRAFEERALATADAPLARHRGNRVMQQTRRGPRTQALGRMRKPAVLRPVLGRRRHARLQSPRAIGQLDLDAPVPGRVEPFANLEASAHPNQRVVVGAESRIGQHRCMKTALDAVAMLGKIVEHLHVGLQPQLRQQLDRRGAQQLSEPGVEGADLDPPPRRQHIVIKATQRRRQTLRIGAAQAAHSELRDALFVAAACRCESGQPLVEAHAHFARRLAGERDRENFLRLAAVEQSPQDARDEHPGLAGTRAGLHRDAATRVAGHRVERVAGSVLRVDPVGGPVASVDRHAPAFEACH